MSSPTSAPPHKAARSPAILQSNVQGFRADAPARVYYSDEELLSYELRQAGYGAYTRAALDSDDVLFTLGLPLEDALGCVSRVLLRETQVVDVEGDRKMQRVRAVAPAGVLESNPALIHVTLRAKNDAATIVDVRATSRRVVFEDETPTKVANRIARYIALDASGTEAPVAARKPDEFVPILTLLLVLACGVVYALELMSGDRYDFISGRGTTLPQFIQRWGIVAAPVQSGEWWRILTAGFVHFSFSHVVMNCFALLAVGVVVERSLGRAGFGVVYAAGLVCGGLAALTTTLHTQVATAGASGAIMGAYGATAVLVARFPVLRKDQQFVTFVGWSIAMTIGSGLTNPSISQASHVGGLIAGAVVALILAATEHAQGVRAPQVQMDERDRRAAAWWDANLDHLVPIADSHTLAAVDQTACPTCRDRGGCRSCEGTGRLNGRICRICRGAGACAVCHRAAA